MFSVALIGPDGAGKTTITRLLEKSSSLPIKRIYMGVKPEESNHALFTSRLFELLRRSENGKTHDVSNREPLVEQRTASQKIWGMARIANRIADEWYRQALSWIYEASGHIVLYDRHFLLDFLGDSRPR